MVILLLGAQSLTGSGRHAPLPQEDVALVELEVVALDAGGREADGLSRHDPARPLRAIAVPFRGDRDARRHPVAVVVDVGEAPHVETVERVRLVTRLTEPGRREHAVQSDVTVALPPRGDQPLRYVACERFDAKPGRYQVRIGVRRGSAGPADSLLLDLTVPDFRRDTLSSSGIVLVQRDGAMPAVRAERVQPLAHAVPSLERVFGPGDDVTVQTEIYRGAGTTPSPVEVIATIRHTGAPDVVWSERQTIPARTFGASRQVVSRLPLPLHSLGTGTYQVVVEAFARDNVLADRRVTVRQEAIFSLRVPVV